MSVFDTFTILFKSNAGDVKKDMELAEKSTKNFQQVINESEKSTDKLSTSLLGIAATSIAAFASFEGLKSIIANTQDYNAELERQHILTGQNASDLAAVDQFFAKQTNRKGQVIDWIANSTQALQQLGMSENLVIPTLIRISNEIDKLHKQSMVKMNLPFDDAKTFEFAKQVFEQYRAAMHLPEELFIPMIKANGHLSDFLEKEKLLTGVTDENAKASYNWGEKWNNSTQALLKTFQTLWETIRPLATFLVDLSTQVFDIIDKILKVFAIPLKMAGFEYDLLTKDMPKKNQVTSSDGIKIDTLPPALVNLPSTRTPPPRADSAFYDQAVPALANAQSAIKASDISPFNQSPVTGSGSKILNVGEINIHTQASNPKDVAAAVKEELDRQYGNTINNYDDNISR